MAEVRNAWFVGREAGLGMRPVTWQGWLLAGAFAAWIAAGLSAFVRGLPADNRVLAIGLWLAGAALLLFVMRRRTIAPR